MAKKKAAKKTDADLKAEAANAGVAPTSTGTDGPIGTIKARPNTRLFTLPASNKIEGIPVGERRFLTQDEAEKLGLYWKE